MSQEEVLSSGDHQRWPGSASLNERIKKVIASHDNEEVARLNTESEGISLKPKDHINRAVANIFQQNYREAITDAGNALLLDSNDRLLRGRPYLHMGCALIGLTEFDHGFTVISEGIKIDSADIQLKRCLELARVEATSKRASLGSSRGTENTGDTFDGGEMWLKLEGDASTRGYRHDLEFQRKISEVRKDNLKLGEHLREDKQVLKALEILVNVKFSEDIGRVELEAEMERQGVEGSKERSAVPMLEKMSLAMILMIAGYKQSDIEKLCQMVEQQDKEVEKMAEEALAMELQKLAVKGANMVEEETGEVTRMDYTSPNSSS
ncbi:hypothetical protein MLD38_036545 [Melastoma candidum]|uniref:Uncharacterized protein n=1 Tax=Melastoma candidum TaxID=119954 RepID=A0ACB9LL82_9MYRT|nr:hypothetical protein MLD38_036545 [Melastoma candidum]